MYKISKEIADILRGKSFAKDMTFNPVQDINGEWFISPEEQAQNTNWRYREFLTDLQKAEFVPPIPEDLFK